MLLACPNCNTVFRIEKTAIGSGRRVNCGVCKNVWIATQENLMEEKKVSENTEKIFKEKNLPLKDKMSESKTTTNIIKTWQARWLGLSEP